MNVIKLTNKICQILRGQLLDNIVGDKLYKQFLRLKILDLLISRQL